MLEATEQTAALVEWVAEAQVGKSRMDRMTAAGVRGWLAAVVRWASSSTFQRRCPFGMELAVVGRPGQRRGPKGAALAPD